MDTHTGGLCGIYHCVLNAPRPLLCLEGLQIPRLTPNISSMNSAPGASKPGGSGVWMELVKIRARVPELVLELRLR